MPQQVLRVGCLMEGNFCLSFFLGGCFCCLVFLFSRVGGFLVFVAFTWVSHPLHCQLRCGRWLFGFVAFLWLFASSAFPVGFGLSGAPRHPPFDKNTRLIESSLFRSSCDSYFLDSLPLIVRSSWGGLPPPNPPAAFLITFLITMRAAPPPPPNPPALFGFLAEIKMHP